MIKFFRKIRHKLLSEGKLKNYLAYALGEILLVMIGILLALQLNNWNEERKEQIKLDKILETVLIDFERDLPIVKQKIKNVEAKMARTDSVVLGKIPPEMLKDCYYCVTSHIWFDDLSLPNKGLNMLADFEFQEKAPNDTLITELLIFFKYFEEANATYYDLRFKETAFNTKWQLENIDYTIEEFMVVAKFHTNETINTKLLNNPENLKRMVLFQAYERVNLQNVLSYYERNVTELKKNLEKRFHE